MHTRIDFRSIVCIAFEVNHQSVRQIDHQRFSLFLILFKQFWIRHQEIRKCFQGAPEFTQVFECFLSSSKGSANREDQREYNGDADQREIHVKFNVVPKGKKGHDQGDDHGDPGSVIDNDQVLFHGWLFDIA